jgi:hypothetical protein
MSRRVRIGQPLPGAARAHSSAAKWAHWILAQEGHGDEWAKVFHVGRDDLHLVWAAIARAIRRAPVGTIRDRGDHGLVCGVAVTLTLNARSAVVMTSWHYRAGSAVPRLVTAYPIT